MYLYHDLLILRSMQYCIYSSAIVLHIIFKEKISSTARQLEVINGSSKSLVQICLLKLDFVKFINETWLSVWPVKVSYKPLNTFGTYPPDCQSDP